MNQLQPKTLLDLPDELLLKIVEFLPTNYMKAVRHTCSRLYRITQSKTILKNYIRENHKFVFEFFESDLMREEEMLHKMNDVDVEKLSLEFNLTRKAAHPSYREPMMLKILDLLGPKISCLHFQIHFARVSFSIIEEILRKCVNLRELRISGYAELRPFKSIKPPSRPEETNTKLDILLIHNCYFSSNQINVLLNFYPAIRTLELFFTNIIQNDGWTDEYVMNKISTYNRCIQKLDLCSVNETGFEKTAIMKLASSELNLHSLCLRGVHHITKTEYQALFSKYRDLKEVKLLQKSSSHFHAFSLPFNINLIPSLSQMGTNLKILELECAIVHLAGNNTLSLQFPNLEHVKLLNVNAPYKKENYFLSLENCRLKHLALRRCCFKDSDIVRIIYASQETLITLEVHEGGRSTDYNDCSTVSYLPLCFSKLEELDISLSHSESLRSAILREFEFPYLKKLRINTSIDTQDYKVIMAGCPLLEDLFFYIYKNNELEEILEERPEHTYRSFDEIKECFSSNLGNDLYFLRSFGFRYSHEKFDLLLSVESCSYSTRRWEDTLLHHYNIK